MFYGLAGATVGGVWLAFMGDLRARAAPGFVIACIVARPVLHVKRIPALPFA